MQPIDMLRARAMGCVAVAICLVWQPAGLAQKARDVVYLTASPASASLTTVTGEVLDFTGQELTMRLPSGQEQRYTRSRIVRVETDRLPEHKLALKLIEQQDDAAALAQLNEAYRLERRRWVLREILSLRVRCRHEMGQFGLAGEEFLVLVRSDPSTLHFDCIPLSWTPLPAGPDLQSKARTWLVQRDQPVAVLLGASYLISLGQGGEALDALRRLTLQDDRRIVALALAQSWRVRQAEASDREIEQWLRELETMPEEIRGGPYYLVGQTLARRQDLQRATLLLLRFALLRPYPRGLAARALGDAADMLARLGQTNESERLQDELIREYSRTPVAAEVLRQRGRPVRTSDGTN